MAVPKEAPGAQAAVTDYKVLHRAGGLAVLALRPLTGRTHQLRAHLAHIGAPILGDAIYGGASRLPGGPRLHLHARRVAMPADDIAALAGGHPGALAVLAEEKRSRRAQAVADDLRGLADGDESALAVARRWSEDGSGHVDDAIAWLRVWTWDANRVRLVHAAAPAVSSVVFTDACLQAIRTRDRLRGPLKTQWLLHEWLAAWQSATRAARA